MTVLLLRIARFGLVGVTITGFNYLLYAWLISRGWHYLIATTLGWIIGTCASFFGNKYLTFMHKKAVDSQQIGRFLLCYVSQLAIGSTTMLVMIEILNIGYTPAFFINVAITSCYSYIFLDNLVFFKRLPVVS